MNNYEKNFENYKGAKRDSLIPLLQDIQDDFGFLSTDAISAVGKFLNLPTSKIYGVATFYNQFRFNPYGKYNIQICRGTACHVKGSADILSTLESKLNIKSGETTRDGLFSLEVVACIGACGLAPVISINGEFFGKLTPNDLDQILETYREMENKE